MVNIYPLSSYVFMEMVPVIDNHYPHPISVRHLEDRYAREGMRTFVEAILLVHENNRPHILLMQAGPMSYYLPGGRLRQGANETDVLKRKLATKLGFNLGTRQPRWQIGECVGIWWRPNYNEPIVYPYGPPHVRNPRECTKLFLVHLSEGTWFGVPSNTHLISVPLSELFEDPQRYGPIISSIPMHLSRFQLNII